MTANVVVPESGADGVIITQGGSVGGWSLYAHEGKLKYCYNFFGIEHFMITADEAHPGRASTRCGWSSPTTAAGWPRAATSRCTTTARPSARAASRQTQPMVYSADEACDVGADTGSPASPDYGPTGNRFTGEIEWVQTRHRRRQPRPPDHTRGSVQHRDGAAISLQLLIFRMVLLHMLLVPGISKLVGRRHNRETPRRRVSGLR